MSDRIVDRIQLDMFSDADAPAPVLVAYGGGVDSTAMIIEMHARGERIDMVLMALTNSENPLTDAFVNDVFAPWMAERNIPFQRVAYQAKNFKNFPIYQGLYENCLTNGTLPSISFGFSSCSIKNKQNPQDSWTNKWEPAVRAWAAGKQVTKVIGYDFGQRDSKRYADAEKYQNDKYNYRYPLREWQWDREKCKERIRQAGMSKIAKSSCYMCAALKTYELDAFKPTLLRRIILLEARAFPRLRNVEGLWRKSVQGLRPGSTKRPGSMTQYIREQGLLSKVEIDRIWNHGPRNLVAWQESHANTPLAERPKLAEWLAMFDAKNGMLDDSLAPLLVTAA